MSTRRLRFTSVPIAVVAAVFTVGFTAPVASAAPPTSHPVVGTAGRGMCLDVNSSEVKRGLRAVGPPIRGANAQWVLRSKSMDRTPNCPPLLWAAFDTSRGTASSPVVVLLFRPGKYLGATNRPTSYMTVTQSTPVSVTVKYRWLGPNDPNAAPSGGPVYSTFVQVFDRVLRFGELPPGV